MITYTPFEHSTDPNPRPAGLLGPINLGLPERAVSALGGAALVGFGLSRRSLPGLLLAGLGGLLLVRGASGHCSLYEQAGLDTFDAHRSGVHGNRGIKLEKSITIHRTPEDLFRFWRNLENLPEFLENIESIRMLDDRRSHWVVKGPAGRTVEWDAEIVNEHPNEMISWQTLPGADVQSAGTVRFTKSEDGQGTVLRVVMEFYPPAGILGASVARFFGRNPEQQLEVDLARLKERMETKLPMAG